MNIERWSSLMDAWGFDANQVTYHALVEAYGQGHRHYHTAEHVNACLQNFDRCAAQADNPREVELALWFHDAVYSPLSGKNELRSAEWASSFLSKNNATSNAAQRVHALIMATMHNAPSQSKDESILIDVDLSILGVSSQAYEAFEVAVRKEYKYVPGFLYRKKRAAVLQQFLGRTRIYQNEPFSSQLEGSARENLSKAVSNLTWHA